PAAGRERGSAVRLDGARDGARDDRRDGVPRVSHAGDDSGGILRSARRRPRRLRPAGFRGGRPRGRGDGAPRGRLEDESRTRRPGAGDCALEGAHGPSAPRGPGRRCRIRRRRPAPGAGRHGLCRRGKRNPRMARPAGSDVRRRRGNDRRASPRTPDVRVSPTARAAEVAAAAQLACLLEASAPKPGNVSPLARFHDATYEDFLASAVAIGPALAAAGERPLGATIRAAVEATARWAPSNTNLGLVLLLAPLARAALRPGHEPLRSSLAATLAETTIADADDTYAAIRLAAPGGLGRADDQDVAHPPTASLRAVMTLAA